MEYPLSNQLIPSIESGNNHLASIHLTERQVKYISAINSGKSREESRELAGYSESSKPSVLERSPNMRKALLASMETNGLTSDYLGKKIKEGIEAKKKYFSAFKGEIVSERIVEDNETQVKYVRTALEIRGDLESGVKVEMNLGIVEIPGGSRSPEAWNEGK